MRTFCSLGLVLLAACPGEAPPPRTPDAGEELIEGQRISGRTIDYFNNNMPLGSVSLATDGVDPPLTATSDAEGAFAFERVPVGSQIFFSVSRAGFRPTRNMPVTIADAAVTQDFYAMSGADIDRQYTSNGRTPTAGRAFIAAELQRDNGSPLVGVPLADVQLVDAQGAPVAGVVGPWVFNTVGVTSTPTATEEHLGKSRVAFLDVPAGTHSIKVTYLDGQGQPKTITTSVTVVADGATIVRAGGMIGATGGGPGGIPQNPKFAKDIYPRLQTAANSGLGCANCHTVGGIGAIAVFNVLAPDVLAALKARTGMIDTATPANSLLLTKPLYETAPPQNHPNATFIDVNDPNYKVILLWIQQGALP